MQLRPSKGDGSLQLLVGSQPVSVRGAEAARPLPQQQQVSVPSTQSTGRYQVSQSQRRVAAPKEDAVARKSQTTHLTTLYPEIPSIPTEFLLNSDEMRPVSQIGLPRDHPSSGSRNIDADHGLGLVIPGTPTPTVPDSPVASARHLSADGQTSGVGPDAPWQDAFVPTQQLPSLDVNTAIPDLDWDGIIQNAADLANTNETNTPDLAGLLQTLQDAKAVTATLSENANQSDQLHNGSIDARAGSQVSQSFQAAVKRLPSILLQLSPLLSSLDEHIKKYPSISTSLVSLKNRVEALETTSFSVVNPEDVEEKFDQLDSRLLEIENKQEDHDRRLASLDAEQGMQVSLRPSGTGSALASFSSSVGMDAAETEEKLRDVEERLQILETSAPPSFEAPWEVEVVFLPWGRDLKGVWAAPGDFKQQNSANATQDSEEWAVSRSVRSSSRLSSLQDQKSSGWSNQAIQNWVEGESELLYGKACSTNGLVYKRLQSRGLVRDVVFTSPGAREVLAAIDKAFGDALTAILGTDAPDPGRQGESSLGLLAKCVPLRKIHKSSRLRFLTPGEMVTSTLWTAEFLASSVMMRCTGKKRLFVTQSAAYHQDGNAQAGWTWQKLRELPRIYQDAELSKGDDESSAGHVAEADAKEACWAYHPSLDPIPSAHSSFASQPFGSFSQHLEQSSQHDELNAEQDGRGSHQSSVEPSLHSGVQAGALQPITPVSEFPPSHTPRVLRTVSDPPASHLLLQPQRQIASFDDAGTATGKAVSKTRPASQLSPVKQGKIKRRRLELPLSDEEDGDVAMSDAVNPFGSLTPLAQRPGYSIPSRPSRHGRADSHPFSSGAWAPTPARSHENDPDVSVDFVYGGGDALAEALPARPSTSGSLVSTVLVAPQGQNGRGYAPRSGTSRPVTRAASGSMGNRRRSVRSITPCAYATPFSGPGGGYLRRGSGSALGSAMGSMNGAGAINMGVAMYGGSDWAIDPDELGLMSVDDFESESEYEEDGDEGADAEDSGDEEEGAGQALHLSDVEGLEREDDDGDEDVWEGVEEDAEEGATDHDGQGERHHA